MSKIGTAIKLLLTPMQIIPALGSNGLLKWIPDKIYLRIVFRCNTGEKLHLKNPITFNEKLQWLKLYDRRPEYSIYADKFEVREFIIKTLGEQYLIPLIGVYERVEDIPWDDLPDKFVLKCTHGSGCNIICSDKSKLDIPASVKKLQKWMRTNYFWINREWIYKYLHPRIICEKYMVDESETQLKDYKVLCFNGRAKVIQVHYDRFTDHKINRYTTDWELINTFDKYHNDPPIKIPKPLKLEEMLRLAETLSKNILHVRVDFYSIDNIIYFSEMTFFHGGGYSKYLTPELGKLWGDYLKLPNTIL